MSIKKIKSAIDRHYIPGSLTFLTKSALQENANTDFPLMVNIEPTNDCNLTCIMCPRKKSVKPVGYMDFDLYCKIIDEAASYRKLIMINYHKDGESLMYKRLPEMIRYAKKLLPDTITHLNTNALVLNDEMANELIEVGLDDVTISLDAATEKTYKKLKGSSEFSKVEENVRNFIKLRNSMNRDTPYIRIKIMRIEPAISEIDIFKKKWIGAADEVQVTGVHDWLGAIKIPFIHHTKEDIKKEDLPKQYSCILLWYALAINWDGSVSVCCADWNSQGIVGDINKNSIHEIWNSREIKHIRKLQVKGDFDKTFCKKCLYWSTAENCDDWLISGKEFYV